MVSAPDEGAGWGPERERAYRVTLQGNIFRRFDGIRLISVVLEAVHTNVTCEQTVQLYSHKGGQTEELETQHSRWQIYVPVGGS